MLTFVKADIFTLGADALVLPANTVGTLGGGLAASFNRRYPDLLLPYRAACNSGELRIGTVFAWTAPTSELIVCLPTKTHYRLPSEINYVEQGLRALRRWAIEQVPGCLALPALGCGLGGLDCAAVRPMIERELDDLRMEVYVCEPDSPSEPPKSRRVSSPRRGARAFGRNR